jgi:hypothetical protein
MNFIDGFDTARGSLNETLAWAKYRLRKVDEAIEALEGMQVYYLAWGIAERNTAFGYEPVNSVSPDSKCSGGQHEMDA